jgi:argininosuccinate synthase
MDEHGVDVVALIVDVGQRDDLEEVQARAVACGAIRAHVIDRCEAFARHVIGPAAAASTSLDQDALERLAHPVIAAALVEVAAIEGADVVAHASAHESLDNAIGARNPALRVLAPAREWVARHVDVADYVKRHRLSPGGVRVERHLLIRRPVSMASGCEAASVAIGFEDGRAASVNGVSMGLPELIESLSLIGGRYGLGESAAVPAPALDLLQAAHAACGGRGSVTLLVRSGSIAVAGPADASAGAANAGPYEDGRHHDSSLVNHS